MVLLRLDIGAYLVFYRFCEEFWEQPIGRPCAYGVCPEQSTPYPWILTTLMEGNQS